MTENKRFTLNTDSADRYYQITDEVTGDLFDVYKLSQCETLYDLLNSLNDENEQLKEKNERLKLRLCEKVNFEGDISHYYKSHQNGKRTVLRG